MRFTLSSPFWKSNKTRASVRNITQTRFHVYESRNLFNYILEISSNHVFKIGEKANLKSAPSLDPISKTNLRQRG